MPTSTLGQRISRAKARIAAAAIPYRIPEKEELPGRLAAVLAVVYVTFATGHHAPAGEGLQRVDLAREAIRLARLLCDLMPGEPECLGLLALLLSTHARAGTRLDEEGGLVLLGDADRSRWDRRTIGRAVDLTRRALRLGRPGPYQLQAAISCLHGVAPDAERTDWAEIARLYALLETLPGGPPVRVNRSVAVAELEGPEAGLALLEPLGDDPRADGWHLYHAVRADFLRRVGRTGEARTAYRAALARGPNAVDRASLQGRLGELGG